jgi:hypothetical protein
MISASTTGGGGGGGEASSATHRALSVWSDVRPAALSSQLVAVSRSAFGDAADGESGGSAGALSAGALSAGGQPHGMGPSLALASSSERG